MEANEPHEYVAVIRWYREDVREALRRLRVEIPEGDFEEFAVLAGRKLHDALVCYGNEVLPYIIMDLIALRRTGEEVDPV